MFTLAAWSLRSCNVFGLEAYIMPRPEKGQKKTKPIKPAVTIPINPFLKYFPKTVVQNPVVDPFLSIHSLDPVLEPLRPLLPSSLTHVKQAAAWSFRIRTRSISSSSANLGHSYLFIFSPRSPSTL